MDKRTTVITIGNDPFLTTPEHAEAIARQIWDACMNKDRVIIKRASKQGQPMDVTAYKQPNDCTRLITVQFIDANGAPGTALYQGSISTTLKQIEEAVEAEHGPAEIHQIKFQQPWIIPSR